MHLLVRWVLNPSVNDSGTDFSQASQDPQPQPQLPAPVPAVGPGGTGNASSRPVPSQHMTGGSSSRSGVAPATGPLPATAPLQATAPAPSKVAQSPQPPPNQASQQGSLLISQGAASPMPVPVWDTGSGAIYHTILISSVLNLHFPDCSLRYPLKCVAILL